MKYYLLSIYYEDAELIEFADFDELQVYLSTLALPTEGVATYRVIHGVEMKVDVYPSGTVQLRDEA